MSINVPTYEKLKEDCLDRVSDTMDKREGSMIGDAVSPCMWELYGAYNMLNIYSNNSYPGTADREGLIEIAKEQGLAPHPATYSVVKGEFTPVTLELAIGTRFNREDVNFSVTEKLAPGVYSLTCETSGTIGNVAPGIITPVDNITGLETANITEILVHADNEEDTEVFRARYFDSVQNKVQDGNVAQYKAWADAFPGVGRHRITPGFNGRNTLKVAILSSVNGVASDTLVNDFQAYLDPANDVINDDTAQENYPQGRGLGNGVAPIGAIVTVSTATERPINVEATITLAPGYTSTGAVTEALRVYLNDLAFTKSTVSYLGLGAALIASPAVEAVSSLLVNGGAADIPLGLYEIPVVGATDWTVVE